MARKKKVEIDPRALQLREVKAEISELEKTAKSLRADLLKDYEPGVYPGFVILLKSRSDLDKDLLEAKLGDLAPFRKVSSVTYIEFPKS